MSQIDKKQPRSWVSPPPLPPFPSSCPPLLRLSSPHPHFESWEQERCSLGLACAARGVRVCGERCARVRRE
eukprot:2621108-Rhodomonas_salina.1